MTLTNVDANSKIVDVVADIDVEESKSFVTTDSLLLYVVVNDNVLTKALNCHVRFAFSDVTIQEGNDFNKIAYS